MLMRWGELSLFRHIVVLYGLLIFLYRVRGGECAGRPGVLGAPHVAVLRQETEELFYHGFEGYMKYAFPEDELRPLSCKPLTRDRINPSHVEVNDVLGNYSLTLIDSLSTLAILASSPGGNSRKKPLLLFQNGVKDLVEQYGDGSTGRLGQGKRARGFDLDSKVQVFETAIRGLGGLLSAHLFAVGDLPITGYSPPRNEVAQAKAWNASYHNTKIQGVTWRNGLVYNGQLLRLAHDLGNRLVPAFWTSTGIPYPRVNLRHGIPFYVRSPGNYAPDGQCENENTDSNEITETCSAGAGSLVLEFTVLSRLTGDPKFEELAKRAFWAIWTKRSPIDLVGSGIDAETGVWLHAWTGIGAGIDSFFEYAFKSSVLLSGADGFNLNRTIDGHDPRSLFEPLTEYEHSAQGFLDVWETSHTAIKHHIYRGANFQHPHYIQVDLATGASRAFWVDALSAYYPGLLVMSGHVEEAIEAHLMSTALWARFSGLPERYNMASGTIEAGLNWWIGRPELIESTWYLYRATEDPYYIYVGEMFLRDIKRRCWTKCGLAGLQNVVTGEQTDRMESFFLGETAKYLFLLFHPDHPLNKLDESFVFSTEGHPLIIPPDTREYLKARVDDDTINDRTCPAAAPAMPFSISNVAARGDVYHAASLARLHLMPEHGQIESALTEYAQDHPSITLADVQSPSNWTYYPWTLPLEMVPRDAKSSAMPTAPTFELSFPALQNQGTAPNAPLQRLKDGVLINHLGGLRLSMVQDVPLLTNEDYLTGYRIHGINNVALGKDERVYLTLGSGKQTINPHDPLFTRVRDLSMLDIVVDVGRSAEPATATAPPTGMNASIGQSLEIELPVDLNLDIDLNDGAMKAAWNSLLTQISDLVRDAQDMVLPLGPGSDSPPSGAGNGRILIPAISSIGVGAAPLPDWPESSSLPGQVDGETLPWAKVFSAGYLCDDKVVEEVLRSNHIILIKRGNCAFAKKLSNIPNVRPNKHLLQLVIVVDYESTDSGNSPAGTEISTRPLLDEPQVTSSGLPRQNSIPLVMVGGGEVTYELLRNARGLGVKRRYSVTSQGVPIANLLMV